MAFGISRIFKSTDVGAPQLGKNMTSFCALLKAVLIDGYGSTPPLGWELAYYNNTDKLVVRPTYMGYMRPFVRFYDYSAQIVDVTVYSTMSSIDAGTEKKPESGMTCISKYHTNSLSAIPWIIIGDEAGFYLLLRIDNRYTYSIACYLGAINMYDVRNKFNFCVLCKDNLTASDTVGFNTSSNETMARGVFMSIRNSYFGKASGRLVPLFMEETSNRTIIPGAKSVYGVHITAPMNFAYSSPGQLAGQLPGFRRWLRGNLSEAITVDNAIVFVPTRDGGQMALAYITSVPNDSDSNFNIYSYENYTFAFKIGKGFRNVW